MERNFIKNITGFTQHGFIPLCALVSHCPTQHRITDSHNANGRVNSPHGLHKRAQALCIRSCVRCTNLPLPPNLVAHAPPMYAIRFRVTIGCPPGTLLTTGFFITVSHPACGFLRCSRAVIDYQERLRAYLTAVGNEFIRSYLVALFGLPGLVHAHWTLIFGSNAVFPMIATGEISTGIADHRRLEGLHQAQRIWP